MRPVAEGEPLVLTRGQTVALIRAYGSRRPLWDSAQPGYFSRQLRARLWRSVAAGLAMPDAAVPALKKRIESLLGSYRREKSREKQSIASGLGPDEVYKSKWYGYEHFHFMSEKTVADDPSRYPSACITHEHDPPSPDITHTIKMEYDAYEDEEYVANESDHEPQLEEEQASVREGAAGGSGEASARRAARQANLAFGQYVASELSKHEGAAAARVKQAIFNVILEADLAAIAAAASTTTSAAAPTTVHCTSATSDPTDRTA